MDRTRATVSDKQLQNHHLRILQTLGRFPLRVHGSQRFAHKPWSKRKPLRSDIRAVVSSGDASTKGFHHLKAVLEYVFDSLQADWLMDFG